MAEYFRLGEEVVTYGDIEELVYLVDVYLKDDARRKQIARCGQERIRQDFTYERAIRSIVEQALGERL
ncbi:MAG: glycosyltransferase [bacterium]|nr:glycosyltransferase [bacterium]